MASKDHPASVLWAADRIDPAGPGHWRLERHFDRLRDAVDHLVEQHSAAERRKAAVYVEEEVLWLSREEVERLYREWHG